VGGIGADAGDGDSAAAATALADGEGLSAAGAGRPHELLMSTTTSADTTSFMDMERCRDSLRFGSGEQLPGDLVGVVFITRTNS
jgi:hypothetical protein